MGAPLIADYLTCWSLLGDDVVVVSPDHGGVTSPQHEKLLLNV